ncbi:hypothetical protein AB5J56_02135 [Streptomyces sp. R21]|uniref:Uncharacterized protein n=1 Tax=Streptomyces sp. R21 TaxID=3238627 RepID=A0AB39P3C2_9ACTN
MPAAVVCGAGSATTRRAGCEAGRAVLLVPHRSDASDEGALPGDYRKAAHPDKALPRIR